MRISVEEGQISLFDLPEEEFKITDEEITEVLLNRYKKDIYIHFIKDPYNDASFIKDVYGTGGSYGYVLKAYRYSGVDYNSSGLKIQKQDGDKKAEITLNWNQVASRIKKLIKENRYLTNEEKIKYELNEVFKITEEDRQRVLMFNYGLGYVEAKIRVYKNFISNNNSCSDRFLKEAYGTCGKINGKDSKGIGYSDTYMENGIEIAKGEIKTFMPWNYINQMLYELIIKKNIFLTDEEKVKYGLVKETPVPNKPKEENNDIDKIIKHYKDTCRFIVKGEYGVMIHLRNKAFFYGYDGKKTSINSSFVPPKPLGKVLVDNIGAYKKSTVLDKKVTEVAIKSTKMDKEVTSMDIKLKKGQAVKVCAYSKERLGEVWRLQSNGCISILFKDTNSIGAYPRKFIKAVKEKLKIRLLEDCTDIKNDFLKGNVYEVWMEQPENYIIRIDGVAYGPLKKSCEIV